MGDIEELNKFFGDDPLPIPFIGISGAHVTYFMSIPISDRASHPLKIDVAKKKFKEES